MTMIKKLIIATIILLPCFVMAQGNGRAVMLQMRNGKIYFDNTYSLSTSLKKELLFDRALNWLKGGFENADKSTIATDAKKGEVNGTGIFKIITSESGHYFWLRFVVNIVVNNATYEIKAYDFYEEPIEPGVSNEYSKIEYRWRDYRQGKPWGPEDKVLFEGMDKNIKEMLASLETVMGKQ